VIAEILDRSDAARVALVAGERDGIAQVRRAVGLLTDAMVSHLSSEARELVESLARLGFTSRPAPAAATRCARTSPRRRSGGRRRA
jgi:hypothetical protein